MPTQITSQRYISHISDTVCVHMCMCYSARQILFGEIGCYIILKYLVKKSVCVL